MARVRVQVPVEQTAHQQPTVAVAQPVEQPGLPQMQRKLMTRNNLLVAVVVVVVIVIVAMLFTLMNDRKNLQNQVNKLNSGQANDTQKYESAVAKLVDVPSGVTPTVKSPTNDELTKLVAQNSLYKNAKNGDVFLVYSNPDKSIFLVIYRPGSQKVILAVLDTSQQSGTSTTKP